jgi:hypothetical protein
MNIFKARTFHWWEIGLIKLCLISLGIILDTYFYNYLSDFTWLWWTLFIVLAVYFIFKLIKEG